MNMCSLSLSKSFAYIILILFFSSWKKKPKNTLINPIYLGECGSPSLSVYLWCFMCVALYNIVEPAGPRGVWADGDPAGADRRLHRCPGFACALCDRYPCPRRSPHRHALLPGTLWCPHRDRCAWVIMHGCLSINQIKLKPWCMQRSTTTAGQSPMM